MKNSEDKMCEKILVAVKNVELETTNSDLVKTCQNVIELLKNDTTNVDVLIDKLSDFILNFEDALLYKKYLPNLLLALVSTKIPLTVVFSNQNYDLCTDSEKTSHLEYSVVLGLLSDHPDILQYALKYFQVNSIPPYDIFIHHEDSYNVAPKKRRLLDHRQKITDYHIVNCCYSLLTKLPNELSSKWDWTTFITNFSNHEDIKIRWMVKECMVILANMTELQSRLLSENLDLSQEDNLKNIPYSKDISIIDGNEEELNLNSKNIVNIEGILLPVYDKNNLQPGKLVPVKSTVNNLRSLALAVASGQALSLMGPVGSGKTCLVEHLAAITGRKGIAFKKIQLGDQTDSRMLLGSHQCTDVPGEFVWAPGVLTEAVQNGHWLLLEDIDYAALDVASTLSSLLERSTLCVPGYRDALPVTPGFQLFVTQRTVITNYGFQKKLSNSSTLLQKHLTQINVEPLSRTELAEIIQNKYPNLSTICPKMIEVFMMFSVGSHDASLQTCDVSEKDTNITVLRGSRLISTRDLMKWCARAVVGFNVSSPESAIKVLEDALDIFTYSISSPENRLELAKKVGTCLGIVEAKSEFYVKHYKPNVSLRPNVLEVGRARVPRVEKSIETIQLNKKRVVFSFTRQSACLLERIACCVNSNEAVLLVGETGTGKTSSIQYLARQTGHKLIVINMNQQSDSADLLGGYKPVDLKYVIKPMKTEYIKMFKSFYNVEKNKKFIEYMDTCCDKENWTALLILIRQSHKAAITRLTNNKKDDLLKVWVSFGHKLSKMEKQVESASRLTFAFIEGSLVKAMQEGHWVLLDEINLASAEILECLAGLLEDKSESIDLLEKGDKVPIKRHPDFTLFACMNPATDIGKKDLPVGLRNRFTEFFIDELTERNDLMLLIGDYLYHMNLSRGVLEAIYNFYSTVKKEAKLNLVDGAGNAPHYSLRTLCRALTAAAKAKCGTVARSLYESFCLSFLTQLDRSSHPKVEAMIAKAVIGKTNSNSFLNQQIPEPKTDGQKYLRFEGHWIPQGKLEIDIPDGYILTPTVRKNLRDISRIISLGRLPVLLQGDTSVGKTSLITYIGKASGNYCVRINNHEHTDLQEYIGSYATDSCGNLVFKEGVLVEAMRKGYWIILDELNLAPSDVLEALNRVLDDNRELFIPETQEVVKADPNFMLFATQNPPGLYGGRKMLSRAFRNRFVELHFDEIPRAELETILHQRCHIPPTYCKKMIDVMAELQVRRRGSAAVQGKDGFITLRDLFRWGQRYKQASKEMLTTAKFYDWDQHIADEGYLILAGKVRQTDERNIIEEVMEKHIKRKVNPENIFSLHPNTSPVTKSILEMILNNQLNEFSHIVWTFNMRRLAVLIAKAFIFNEPVLLVGETGCGKTTVCQVLAALSNRKLSSVNCHMHTESSDFLGGLRPVRQYKNDGRLFEWVDGPLIKAMENGDLFLADEISLADDSVLERLNSLLEPERQLVISERGMEDGSDLKVITAVSNFHFIGTMNPGGDFGKKELSPALRNRFTEIWCDHVSSKADLQKVLEKSVGKGIALGNQEDGSSGIGNCILEFTDWLKISEVTNKFPFSIRDLLSWVQFINMTVSKGLLDAPEAYVHGACMTFLDCFGTTLTGHIDSETLSLLRKNAINFLLNQMKTFGNEYTESLGEMLNNKNVTLKSETNNNKFGIKPFFIDCGPYSYLSCGQTFTFTAPTTGSNTLRLLRGLQLNKAILLEGNPGVGKTSLVTALAKSSGHKVVRINLSDQTDITDLFGTDLPSEDGSFTFKEGAFLNALQNGDWILLDELNLAPQPVLEGLNACLDHRGEIFIPELGKTFKVKKETKLFACQNPLKQGGARRGLPVSFLNRFTQVYIDTLTKDDLIYIVEAQYPHLHKDILHKMVEFNCKIAHEVTEVQAWGHKGGPWEMNLRDIQRWCDALVKDLENGSSISPGKYVDMLYVNRMRTEEDKKKMTQAFDEIFCPEYNRSDRNPQIDVKEDEVVIGDVAIKRNKEKAFKNRRFVKTNLLVLRNQLSTLKSLAQNVNMNWLSILVGPTATGKSSIIQVLADLTGNDLHVVPVTSAMDVSDLLGFFEQVDYNRNIENLYDEIETATIQVVRNMWIIQKPNEWKSIKLLSDLYEYKSLQSNSADKRLTCDDIELFNEKNKFLLEHCKKILEAGKLCNITAEGVEKIMNNLTKLQSRVSNLTSVNAGGKFEWVDSLLVKTMVEGSWLLLDNVNLTSSAVLDRLNGLLEPNGVLSVPERGEISEIKPHPNFRVFFTMDPKYGEISRAMRNRGVEIFLLRPEDLDLGLSETMDYMDLVALLSSSGLPNQYHDICIRCHESMTAFIQGLERPTISHLIQAVHLTWQQIVRGISCKTALLNSFSDVYIKPRSGGDFASSVNTSLAEMKNNMLKALESELSTEKYAPNVSKDVSHTLTIKGLATNSAYEVAKQITYLPIKQADIQNTSSTLYPLFCVLTSYQKCPPDLLDMLNFILNQGIQKNNEDNSKSLTWNLNKEAHEYVKNGETLDLYKRFFPEAYRLKDESICKANINFALLYIKLKDIELKLTLKNTGFSALDYSNAVTEGKLTDDFIEYPILKNCKAYLQIIDKYVEDTIKSVRSLNDKMACSIIQLLNWRERLIKIAAVPIFEQTNNKRAPVLKEEIIPFLNAHSKWTQKHLLCELFNFAGGKNVLNKFTSEIDELNLNIAKDYSKVAKVSKKLRKYYGQPKLYKNQEEYELSIAREEMYNRINFDMTEPLHRQLSNVCHINMTDISLAYDVPNPDIIDAIKENHATLTSIANTAKSLSEIKLLPINLYIVERIIKILQPYFIEIINKLSDEDYDFENVLHCNVKEMLSTLVYLGKVMKGFPSAILNQLQLMQKLLENNQEPDNSISSLPVAFWIEFNKMLVSSPATHPLPFLRINDLVNTEDQTEAIPSNSSRMSMNLPLMPFYLQNLTTCIDVSTSYPVMAYESVALKDRVEYSMQLQTVLNILWKNIGTLDSTALLKLKSDAIFEIKKYEKLIDCLSYIISENYTVNDSIIENCDVIINEIQTYFKGDANIEDMLAKVNDIYKKLVSVVSNIDEDIKNEIEMLTAELSLLSSLLFVRMMAEISPMDHVEKYRLKIQYIEEDVDMFNKLLSAYYVHGVISGSISENRNIERASEVTLDCYKKGTENGEKLKKIHPYCEVIMNLKDDTASKVHKYASGNTFRPKEPSYNSFVKDCKHFTNSVLSDKSVKTLYTNLLSTCDALYEIIKVGAHDEATKQTQNAQTVLKETAAWLHSLTAFNKRINTYSEAFPDLAKPLQSSLSQIMYSVTTLNDLIRELVAKIQQGPHLRDMLSSLLVYPNTIPSLTSKEKHLNRYVSSNFMQLLNRNVTANDDVFQTERECFEVLKMNLSELSMHSLAMERIDKVNLNAVLTTLNAITKSWEKQRQDIEKREQEEEALYVTKSKCEDENEEAAAIEEIMEMFPSYSDSDFGEFKPPTLEQRKIKTPTVKPKLLITSEDVSLIYKWHSNFVRNLTNAQWLTSPKKLVANDVVSPLLQRYPTFSKVIQGAWEALDVEFEGTISPSLMVLVSHIKNRVDGSNGSNQKVDFYRSAWISETRECLSLLEKVRENTNQLLDQWPDFPTLKDIIIIVDRISGFPITSPVSRFLTGLELLRDKIEEWNKNAHKGNNMIDISLSVGQQIINWRKLEMSHWKECLNNLYHRQQAEAHKYWFYLYAVVTSFLEDGDISSARVVSVLKDFMEKSNLAEFEVRLDIVFVYHCHLLHLEASGRRDELLSLLWNTHNYYGQFSSQVASHIKEKRAPIEKKLKDFVKICTWDRDLSYWSVKDTVEKAHKALHKHTKEFEKVLKESVSSCLVDTASESVDHVGIWDRPKRAAGTTGNAAGGAYMIDLQNYVVLNRNIKKYLDLIEQPCPVIPDGSLLSKIPNLLNKARALCKDTITNTGYPALVQGLDDFVTLVIETSEHLGSLEVDSSLPKEKQKSQAKNITQQKRKALADLFKYLSKMGLNYRTGLVVLSASEDLYDFTIPPVDLDAAMSYLKSRRCDATLALLWSGCEKYFQKNIARHRLLTVALQSPHTDLGMQNIDRCKGFASHLLKYTNTQKKSISRYTRHIIDLRNVATSLTNALEIDAAGCNITTLKEKLHILEECYAHTEILLEQFNVVLKSIPEKHFDTDSEPQFDKVLSNSPLADCFKDGDEWKCLNKKIKSIISLVVKQKAMLNKLSRDPKRIGDAIDLPIVSQSHIDATNEAKNNLDVIIEKSNEIVSEYQFVFKTNIIEHFTPHHPVLRCLENLVKYIEGTRTELDKMDEPVDQDMDETSGNILEQTEDIVATMLLVVQSLYKKHLPPEKNAENIDVLSAIDEFIDEGEKEESKEILEDNHLKELLQEKISTDSRMLQLETLVTKLRQLLINYVHYIATRSEVEGVRTVVMRLVPILEQVVLFVQYFVSQKVAVHRVSCKMLLVLLKIFLDLATKGFCKHSDLDSEEGEGEGTSGASGMGLGEGEGQKDVSERIENQDQLDDARKPGEEKDEQDRDCKEEEKGVNMTDDFDSHLQDVEQKEGDSDKENDEDDADKQMGDTDNAAEKLDQQIWGSEDEEDVDEEQNKKEKEERGKGESTGEKEMGAKEEEQGKDDGTEGKEKKKKDINEMEPEVDDDHVDPYHGKHQEFPEPEDFEMPENIDLDGEEKDDKDGETETENPFEIDAMKEAVQEEEEQKENEKDDDKGNKNGLEVSSDEEGDGNEDEKNKEETNETEQESKDKGGNGEDENKEETETPEEKADDETQQDPNNPETEPEHEGDPDKELPKNPDDITEEEEKQESNQDPNPNADPSNRDPSAEDKVENAEMEKGTNDNVQMNTEPVKDEETAPYEQAQEQVGENIQSTGRSELDDSDKGHRGDKQAARAETRQRSPARDNRPGNTHQERTLGDINEKKHKQVHTLEADQDAGEDTEQMDEQADAYQHVKEAKKDDIQVVDAATKEQAEEQPTLGQEEEEEMKDDQVAMDVDDDDITLEKSEEIKPEKTKDTKGKDEEKSGNENDGEDTTGETGVEIEGSTVQTETVPRGRDTTYHTKVQETSQQAEDITMQEYMSMRVWLESGSGSGSGASGGVWRAVWQQSGAAARALCERLRLVLEPTGRSRRAGDFRTGRAINMRRVIPYIASHFRKDRIWLRRTKPAKREYKIAIAIDDSSSMSDNRSKELAFESLALVSQALNLLESGDLAVLSFGEKPNLLHPFTEQFSEHSGSKILEQLRFDQTKTKIAQLLDFCTVMFDQQSIRSDALNAKLLVIVSDGRGIFSEGETRVIQTVRRARQQGIFLVYVIIDNPDNKDSIMDIRRPILDPVTNSLAGFVPYLDTFPFPFYLILRDMSALPTVLGDALRQWFELAANTTN